MVKPPDLMILTVIVIAFRFVCLLYWSKMPNVRLIGKKSPYAGYMLFEILNQLKYYGLGRVVIRNSYKKFPEMSFYIIRKVIPMRETIGPGPDELVYGKVWVDEVYRGRKFDGLKLLQDETYHPDFHLIPKHEEDKYLNFKPLDIVKILPKYVDPPPIIAQLLKEKNPDIKEPKIEAVYDHPDQELPKQYRYKIAEEGETPNFRLKVELLERFKAGIKY